MGNGSILVLLQQAREALHPVSTEITAAAAELASQSSREALGILLADNWNASLERQVKGCGLSVVYVYPNARFGRFIAEEQARALVQCVQELRPDILLAGATPEGRALAAMAAGALRTGVTADCTALSFRKDGLLLQIRPAFGGNVMAQIITPTARPQIATLRYGGANVLAESETGIIFKELADDYSADSNIKAEWLERLSSESNRSHVVIALGGGLAAKEDIPLFQHLAEKTGATLMCSRVLVERGWFPRSAQIGLSGQRIGARLLITFGISGSVQFMAGIQGVQQLCAVNTDESTPIMKAADVPIAGDMIAVANEMYNR